MEKYSLIFGASGGIGKEFCIALAKRGENLVISGRCENKLELLKCELQTIKEDIKIITLPLDLSSSEERVLAFNRLKDLGVIVKGLYYVSGLDTRKAFLKYTEEKIVAQARVNFEGALSTTKFALDNRSENLDILIVSSACGLTPMPYFAEYSATKSALIYFYKGLKKELKGSGVKITVLCPGSVPTRQDIIKDIKSQGLTGKLSKKSPKFVVEKGLKALSKNKTICVPGFYNKVVSFISRITPYSVKASVIAKKFKDKEKDAF